MQKWLVAAMCGMATVAALAATVTLDGVTEYAVASGVTNTVSDTLTGSGSIRKTGAGLLVLSGEGNDFTGGVAIEAGKVRVEAPDALGTGGVTVSGRNSGVFFNVAPEAIGEFALFTNKFDYTGSLGVQSSNYSMLFLKNTRLTGAVTASRNIRLRPG